MERNPGKPATEKARNYEQVRYSIVEPRNEGLLAPNQRFLHDPSSTINTNMRPPDFAMSVGARPVLNYSITGEEFSLEFMRERVNPMQHYIANASGDSAAGAVGYMGLKGILGLSQAGSETVADISMLPAVESNHIQEFERKVPPSNDDRGFYESVRSVTHNASRNDSSRGHPFYSSSQASDSASAKMKVLCSLGGKILPRPSDGKLRYVGGETRIIRMSNNISWQELMQKTSSIYNQACTIKYQLPGEDLDALVSVSCDEDLQNMMEECSGLEDGRSQKLRMFLFSNTELDDSQFGMASTEGDSEIQYVAAVNGMDLGSKKDSINLPSCLGNNLDELYSLNVNRESSNAAGDVSGPSTAPLTSNIPLSALHSIQPASQNSSHCTPIGENGVQMPRLGHPTHQGGFPEEQVQKGSAELSVEETNMQRNNSAQKLTLPEKIRSLEKEVGVKEAKVKRGGSFPKMNEPANVQCPENEFIVSPPTPEVSVSNSSTDIVAALPPKNSKKHQEAVHNPIPGETFIEGKSSKFNNDDHLYTSGGLSIHGHGDSAANYADSGYTEPAVIPRVFRSERIPREQAELNRLSKSDDSFDSQFLITHTRPDFSQPIAESVEKLQTEHSMSSEKSHKTNSPAADDGLMHFENKISAGNINKINSDLSQDSFDSNLQNSGMKHVVFPPVNVQDNAQYNEGYKDSAVLDKAAAAINQPSSTVSPCRQQDTTVSGPQEVHWVEMATSMSGNSLGQPPLLNRTGNSARAVTQGEPPVPLGTSAQGDIIIDINDRFPSDFLSEIFSKAKISGDLSGIGPLNSDGLSLKMENHEPKHWSFFQKLAHDARNDVSLMDQDHVGYSSPLANIEERSPIYSFPPLEPNDGVAMDHMNSNIAFDENVQQENSTIVRPNTMDFHQVDGNETLQFNAVVSSRATELEYEDGKSNVQNTGLDLSFGDFDISTLQIIKNEDLEELKELGSGTFGTVYHGKWRGSDVAIKRIKKSCFTGRSSEQERLTAEFWREADILSKLHHPNVVAFYGVVQDGPGGTLATVTEYMVNGSLRHVLLCKDRHLDRRKKLIIAMDAAFGMEYLHSKNIVHFDLKCDNLLVNLKDPLRPICKVGDFGLSKIKRNTLVTGGVRGTLPWMAPELLNGSSSKVSEKVDVFSFGIVLWEILTGEEPYANMHYGAIIGGIVNNTLRPPVPNMCDSEWRVLMEQCWAPEPHARPSFTEIARRLRVMSAAIQAKPQAYQGQNQVSK